MGAYAYVDDMLYLEVSAYRTLDRQHAERSWAPIHSARPGQFDSAPYWRAAFEPHWGNNWLEIGTFGMAADIHPWARRRRRGTGPVTTATFPQTDKYTDVGFDSQYQYQGDNFWFTLRGSYIHEIAEAGRDLRQWLSTNPTDTLNEARGYASLAYGNDNGSS